MTYKFLRRLGFLTGVLLYTTHIGVLAEPEVVHKLAERPQKAADCSDSRFENKAVLTAYDNCFVAQRQYNNAIKRGLYFCYRMPDWSTQFVKQTKNILTENIPIRISNRITKNYSWLVPEHNNKEHNYDTECNPSAFAPANLKLPKIKDDITCCKREHA